MSILQPPLKWIITWGFAWNSNLATLTTKQPLVELLFSLRDPCLPLLLEGWFQLSHRSEITGLSFPFAFMIYFLKLSSLGEKIYQLHQKHQYLVVVQALAMGCDWPECLAQSMFRVFTEARKHAHRISHIGHFMFRVN